MPSGNGAVSASPGDNRLPHQQWQGRSTRFMRSNEHGRERSGVWNAEGLEGAARAIVAGDEEAGRWHTCYYTVVPCHSACLFEMMTGGAINKKAAVCEVSGVQGNCRSASFVF